MAIYGRTDLASEAHALWRRSAGEATELPGVRAQRERLGDLELTAVEILDAQGEKALGKPRGHYFTLELPEICDRGAVSFAAAAEAIASLLRRCEGLRGEGTVLVVALGNADITPDAVGSLAAESILVTRHLKQSSPLFSAFRPTALCRTGVLGTTGMESALQIRALCRDLRPDCVIAIDALAGVALRRLCRSVQICDTGIAPGSGVGNDRQALNAETLGLPVIAIGVPTVVDASLFSDDPSLQTMFVTPRDIDSAVRSVSRLIGYGLDLALHEGLSIGDIDMLIG